MNIGKRKTSIAVLGVLMISASSIFFLRKPSDTADWAPEVAVLPRAEFKGEKVSVYNIRNNAYGAGEVFTPAYYDKTFDLDGLESVWFIVVPFYKSWLGPAHTMLSFGFKDGSYVSISPEIRRKKDQTYSALKGLFRNYGFLYVIADERDVIRLRADIRKDDIFLYPVQTTPEKMRALFTGMLERANRLRLEPEFYNTAANSCASNIARHVNTLNPGKIPFSYKVLLPGYSDRLAYDLGLLDTSVPFEELRKRHKIDDAAEKYSEDPRFSVRIREGVH